MRISIKADSGKTRWENNGAKEMILVDDPDDREFLRKLLESMWKELPENKKKKKAWSFLEKGGYRIK